MGREERHFALPPGESENEREKGREGEGDKFSNLCSRIKLAGGASRRAIRELHYAF